MKLKLPKLSKNTFVGLFAGILLITSAGNFTQDAIKDIHNDKQQEYVYQDRGIDSNTVEGLMEAGLGSLVIFLNMLLSRNEKLNFIQTDFLINVPFNIGGNYRYDDAEATRAFNDHESDFKEIIMNEFDDPIKSTINIDSIKMNVKYETLYITASIRMLEVTSQVMKHIYENIIKKMIEELMLEKLNDIHDKFLEKPAANNDTVGMIIHEAFEDEKKMVKDGIKILKMARRKYKPI